MKKALKLASALLAGVLALGLVACSSGDDSSGDDDNSSGNNNGGQTVVTTGLTPVRSVAASSASTSVVLSWNDPSDTSNFGGVKITWGDESATVSKGTNTYTATELSAETEYTFTITTLDANLEDTTSKATVKITTPAITIIYKESAESLTVGSKVTVGDATYYVISNQLGTTSAKSSASASISARAAAATDESTETASTDTTASDEDEETDTEITGTADLTDSESTTVIDTGNLITDKIIVKFASDAYVKKILNELGITKYMQLYNLDSRPSSITTNSSSKRSYLVDKFLIADENGNKIAEFKQQFSSTYFVKFYIENVDTTTTVNTSDTEASGAYFAKFDPDTLRQNYEPNQFDVTTYENGVQNYKISKVYNYDKYGEVGTNKANLEHVNYYRHPTKINKTTVFPYVYKGFTDDEGQSKLEYTLDNAKGSQYYGVGNYKKIDSNGDATGETQIKVSANGTSVSDTSSARTNQIQLYFNRVNSDGTDGNVLYIDATLKDGSTSTYGTDEITATGEASRRIQVTLSTLDSSTTNLLDQSVTVKVNGTDVSGSDFYTLGTVLSTFLYDYIRVSSDTTTVNGYTVPAKIYARANFNSTYYPEVAGHDFLNAVLVPVAVDSDSFKYVAVYDSTGADAFESAYDAETATTESSYVPSFATLYKDNITKVAAGTYTDTTTNPFSTAVSKTTFKDAWSWDASSVSTTTSEGTTVSTVTDPTTLVADHLTISGTAEYRLNSGSTAVTSIQLAKAQGGVATIVTDSYVHLVLSIGSTGSNNSVSSVGLYKTATTTGETTTYSDLVSVSKAVATSSSKSASIADDGTVTVSGGTNAAKVTYLNLPAGTYYFLTSDESNAVRLSSVTATEIITE